MSDLNEDPTRDGSAPTPDGSSGGTPDELRLRKVLATMNDLEPPRDDLFAQRAVIRGRAATARRRSTLFRAAAALVVVAACGGGWYAVEHGAGPTTTSSAANGAGADSNAKAPAEAGVGSQGYSNGGGSSPQTLNRSTALPGAGDAWFPGPTTPATRAFLAVEPTVVDRWPDVFSGAYATDGNAHVVVATTRPDAALEAFVRAAMPSPGDVEFTTAAHSYAQKERLAQQVRRDVGYWRSRGVEVYDVHQDGRADQVVAVADEGASAGALVGRYGGLLRVVAPSPPSTAP